MVADGNRRGYRHLLVGFWDEARAHGLALPTDEPIAASSFCTARHKIPSALLKDLLQQIAANELACDSHAAHRWHGKKVFAIDGCKVNLQRDPGLDAHFGVPNGGNCPQALLSVLFDACAGLPLDVEVSPYATSERDHLFEMLPSLESGAVLVMDRGYPSHEVFQALVQEQIDFLARVPSSNTFRAVDDLVASGAHEGMFSFAPPDDAPEGSQTLELRVLRCPTPDGDEAFFVTSLPASDFDRGQMAELYRLRWRIEEFYKLSKGDYIGQGQFRSKSPSGVVQELHALMIFLAITRLCMAAAATTADCDPRVLSQKGAVLSVAAYLTRLLLTTAPDQARDELLALLSRIARVREKPRPGRHHPRRSFKPVSRWHASGRRGA